VNHGFEIGNHTLWAREPRPVPEPIVRDQIARAELWIHRYRPQYRIRTLALPHGVYPKQVAWAPPRDGRRHDLRVRRDLEVAGGPAPSRSPELRPTHLPEPGNRIRAADWLAHFDQNPGERFVSDGDAATVTIPAAPTGDCARAPAGA